MRYHVNFRDLEAGTNNATRFHREASKLRRHVKDFNPDLVELRGSIATLPRQRGYAAQMCLHLPTGTITAEGRGYTRVAAWHDVTQELEVRLERHKARLLGSRGRHGRRRDPRRGHGPAPGPRSEDGSVQASIQASYPDLLAFLRSEIRMHETRGNLPRGRVDAVELADIVAMVVLEDVRRKPADLSCRHWFFKVAYEQLLEAIDETRRSRARLRPGPPLDTVLPAPEGPEGLTEEEDLVNEWIGPHPRRRFGHDIPDPRSLG